jgi:hypothetical protein
MSGQNLTLIAKGYGLTVAQLKELNHLTSDALYVGDVLIIRLGNTPGPTYTPSPTGTPTRAATATRKPTRTPTPTSTPAITASAAITADPVQNGPPPDRVDRLGNILVIAIVVIAAGGVILMVVGGVIRRGSA